MTSVDYGKAYQTGFNRTVRFLIAKGAVRELAEEVAQAAWTRGWERVGQLRDESVVSTWVNKIAFNMHRQGTYCDRREQPLFEIPCEANVNMAAIDLTTILKDCCPHDRTLLQHHLHGLTANEIASVIGGTESAIRLRLMRARRSARSRFERPSPPPAETAAPTRHRSRATARTSAVNLVTPGRRTHSN